MMNHQLIRRAAAVGAIAVAIVVGLGIRAADDNRSPSKESPPTTVAPPVAGPVVDWGRPVRVDLGDGWAVGDAEGDAPLLAVLKDGDVVGYLEYLDFPVQGTLDEHVAR